MEILTEKEAENIEERIKTAFLSISGNLHLMPDVFCKWKKTDGDKKVSKTLRADYYPVFDFIADPLLKNNLSELRMCLDYQWSIYELLKPALTFGRQHKLVMYQIVGAICEGIMFEYLKAYTEREKNKIVDFLIKEKEKNKSFGLGSLIELFYQTDIIDNRGKDYLMDISFLRNTVHPKSLNRPEATYEKNKLINKDISEIIEKLDFFIDATGKRIIKLRDNKVPF